MRALQNRVSYSMMSASLALLLLLNPSPSMAMLRGQSRRVQNNINVGPQHLSGQYLTHPYFLKPSLTEEDLDH